MDANGAHIIGSSLPDRYQLVARPQGGLVAPDVIALRGYRKTIDQCSVKHHSLPRPHISFPLSMHKADRFFRQALRSWYINRLRTSFGSTNDVTGRSSSLAGLQPSPCQYRTSLQQIRSIDRRLSVFPCARSPILIQGTITGRSAFDGQRVNH